MIALERWDDVVAAASATETFGQRRIGAPSAEFSSHAMASCDDDEHRAKRTAAHVLVTRARLERAEARADAIVRELVGTGVRDVHDDLALPLAVRVLLDLLGLPEGRCVEFTAAFATGHDPVRRLGARDLARAAGHREEVAAYIQEELLARVREQRADVLSDWIAALAAHDRRHVVEYLVHEVEFLFFAGTLPVAHAIASALRSPERDVEETLRLEPPIPALERVTRCETMIAGATVPAGAVIELDWRAANCDPERPTGRHLSFGHGVHRCLGVALARIEIAAVRRGFDISDSRSHI